MKKIKNSLIVAFVIILWILPLSGVVVSLVYQIQAQQALFGFFTAKVHIWGLYDLWNLTLLLYIPLFIWCNN